MDSLPAELLVKVLEDLDEDPRDLLNASDSFGPFEDLLDDKIDACRLEEVLPLVFKWLDLKSVLACRQTCKRIQRGVDGILDNLELLSEHRNLDLIRSRFNPPRKPRSFEWRQFHHFNSKFHHLLHSAPLGVWVDSVQKITQFREEMEGSLKRGRPLVCKCLSMFRHPNLEETYSRDLLEAGIQLMTQFQAKLAHVILNLGMLDTSTIETYGYLRRVFLAVPNLVTFGADMDDQWMADHLDDLQDFITQHPLPPMPLLKRVSFRQYSLATSIYQEIATKYGDHLEFLQLHIVGRSLHEHPEHLSPPGGLQPFPVLVEMTITMTWRMRDLLLKMEAPSLVHLNLGLIYELVGHPPPMPMLQFIQIFKSFPNLVDLDLLIFLDQDDVEPFGWNGQRQAFRNGLNNRHPNLKRFKLTATVVLNHFPMGFWMELFPNLENFQIYLLFQNVCRWGGMELPYRDHDLNLFVRRRGYESKVWRMGGASLQTIQILRGVGLVVNFLYTRENYERGRLQQQEQSSCTVM